MSNSRLAVIFWIFQILVLHSDLYNFCWLACSQYFYTFEGNMPFFLVVSKIILSLVFIFTRFTVMNQVWFFSGFIFLVNYRWWLASYLENVWLLISSNGASAPFSFLSSWEFQLNICIHHVSYNNSHTSLYFPSLVNYLTIPRFIFSTWKEGY